MSSIYSWDDPNPDEDIIGTMVGQDQMMNRLSATAQKQIADNASAIYRNNPWLEPGVVLALAKAQAGDKTVANVSALAAQAATQKLQNILDNANDSWFRRNVWKRVTGAAGAVGSVVGKGLEWVTPDFVKPVVKYAYGTAMLVPELVQNSARMITGQTVNPEAAAAGLKEKESRAGWFASTTLGTMMSGKVDTGEGYLPSEDVQKEQAKRAAKYRGTMPDGRAFTAGRGAAYSLNLEGYWGNVVSGVIDGAISLVGPENIVLPEVAGTVRAVRGTEKGIVTAGNAMDVLGATFLAAGKDGTSLVDVAPRFLTWVQNNRYAKRLVGKLTSTRSADEVMRLMSDKITPEDAIRFANADTEEKVIGLFQQLVARERLSDENLAVARSMFERPDGSFDALGYERYLDEAIINTDPGLIGADITDLRGAKRELLRTKIAETRLHQWVDKWTAEVPSSLIAIRGDSRQRMDAVKNVRNYLRTLGGKQVSMTQREHLAARIDNAVSAVADDYATLEQPMMVPAEVKERLELGASQVKATIESQPVGEAVSLDKTKQIRNELVLLREQAASVYLRQQKQMPKAITDRFDELIKEAGKLTGSTLEITRGETIMNKFIMAISDLSTGGRQQAFNSRQEIVEIMEETLLMNGIDPNSVRGFVEANRKAEEIMRAYWVDASGDMTGQKFIKALYDSGLISKKNAARISRNPSMLDDIGLMGPSAVSDLLNHSFILPDARSVRRFDSPFWRRAMSRDAGGVVKGAVATGELTANVADFVVNTIWKRMSLMTGGYIMRNVLDGQLRVALLGVKGTGMRGFLTNPVDFIAWAMGRVGKGGVLGQSWDDAKAAYLAGSGTDDIADAASAELVRNFGRSGHRQVVDVTDASRRLEKNGVYLKVDRVDAPVQHTTGVVDTLGQVNADLGLRLAMEGRTTEEFLQIVRKTENRQFLSQLIDLFKSGFLYRNPETGMREQFPVFLFSQDGRRIPGAMDNALTYWYENVAIPRVTPYKTADPRMERLRFAALYDAVLTKTNKVSGKSSMSWAEARAEYPELAAGTEVPQVGMVLFRADSVEGATEDVIVRQVWQMDLIDEETGELIGKHYEVDVHTAHPGGAFGGEADRGSPFLRTAVDDAAAEGLLPRFVRYAQRTGDLSPEASNVASQRARQLVNWFFGNVSEKAMRKLEKYPFWRQGYYHAVKENVDMLAPEEARRVIDMITEAAAREGISPEDYVGREAGFGRYVRKKIAGRKGEDYGLLEMLERQALEGTGTGTAEQLSHYAGVITNMNMSNIFFEAAQRNNIEDALRVVYPFGAAWREIFTKYASFFAEDPYRAVKATRVYRAGTNLDPDEDGRGWFYRDPQSGEVMFQFPFSNFLGRAFTSLGAGPSLDVGLEAPLKQLNVGFQLMPAMGPLAQIPAAMILKDKPDVSSILHMIAPYGSPSSLSEGVTNAVVPGWVRKMKETFFGNEEDTDTMFAQTYIDTMRALYASGQYETTTKEGEDRLLRDTKMKARAIMGLRTLSQFVGPTSATPFYQVKDIEGRDIYVDVLAQELANLREEDYDTAVARFLDAHGENFMLYLASKTRATDKGQGYEPTEEFMNWSISNKSFLDRYRNTGAYFGPTSDNFSFAAWDYQIRTGKRIYNDPREIIQQAQYITAAERYRQERLKYGPYPNEIEREKLRQIRVDLNARFPGYPVNPVFEVNKFQEVFMPELKKAAMDKKSKNYEITPYVLAYIEAREKAIAALGGTAGTLKTAKRAARVRSALAYYGQQLSNESNEFARLYDRHLAAEVED